jgi:Fic family protein
MDIETIIAEGVKPHSLKKLPPKGGYMNKEIMKELLQARIQIAELKGYCLDYPNPLLLLSPAIIKESLASSEIEDIHTTLIDVLQNALLPEIERGTADKEVLRYREAVIYGFRTLKKRPVIGQSLIIGIQNTLMQVDGQMFRTDQNAIVNKKTKKIIFVPPKVADIPHLMKNWEEYINTQSGELENDPLIKAAIGHYQFESIHPFDDGNGRTGRILMVLQLINAELLNAPILYISGYINDHKSEYYTLLREVTDKDIWTNYILFMIRGFKEQALKTKVHLLETKVLFEKTKNEIKEKMPSIYSHELVEAIFTHPIITPTALASKISVHPNSASNYLKKLQQIGLLKSHKYGKYQMYGNTKLLNLLNA